MRERSTIDTVFLTLTLVARVQDTDEGWARPGPLLGGALFLTGLLALPYQPAAGLLLLLTGVAVAGFTLRGRDATYDVHREVTFRIDRGGVWLDDRPVRVRVDRTSISYDGRLHPLARPLTGAQLLRAHELLDRDVSGEVPAALRSAVVER